MIYFSGVVSNRNTAQTCNAYQHAPHAHHKTRAGKTICSTILIYTRCVFVLHVLYIVHAL